MKFDILNKLKNMSMRTKRIIALVVCVSLLATAIILNVRTEKGEAGDKTGGDNVNVSVGGDETDQNGSENVINGNEETDVGAGVTKVDDAEEYFAAIGENNYQSLLLRQYLTMDIFYCIQEFLKGLGEGNVTISPEVTDIKRIPKVIVSVDTTKMYLKEQFQAAIEARNSVSNDRYGSVIQSAKEYIEKNFSNGELSLNRIAAHIGVSPSYFSSIFKQETGTTFVEYLTKVRIDKACELLRCTNSRTAEIGEQVGYSDPHYFSATFKKVMGQSPKDYRAGQKG